LDSLPRNWHTYWGQVSPAAQRAAALKDRHAFKTEMDDEARRAMFPQNERLKR
jgi:hypothetical protein